MSESTQPGQPDRPRLGWRAGQAEPPFGVEQVGEPGVEQVGRSGRGGRIALWVGLVAIALSCCCMAAVIAAALWGEGPADSARRRANDYGGADNELPVLRGRQLVEYRSSGMAGGRECP